VHRAQGRSVTGRQRVTERRVLRSAKQRALLWLSTDGRCARCGEELAEDAFEADHIEPYSKTHRTNVHEMQPLCKQCNREKGNRE
jgi:5-methylcytosine-specific restriction enzyme A